MSKYANIENAVLKATRDLLALDVLSNREREIVDMRYGLNSRGKKVTLQSLGTNKGLTRERIRQIEAQALKSLSRAKNNVDIHRPINLIRTFIESNGVVLSNNTLIDKIGGNKQLDNSIMFLLQFSDDIGFRGANNHFEDRWYVTTKGDFVDCVEESLHALHDSLGRNDVLDERSFLNRFHECMDNKVLSYSKKDKNYARNWIMISKKLDSNPINEWGLSDANEIRLANTAHRAYLVLRLEKQPLHFRQIAGRIKKVLNCSIEDSTCHNELIKSNKFVLIGRGMYGLEEHGYKPGVVREVITRLLKERGPMSKEDIVKNVTEEREVKESTVINSLYNKKNFTKNSKGLYTVARSSAKK
ncbi:MAG: hypothetical protein OXU73_02970 [Candidatus Campbellbacteria bacterium]|nr:hypothetical protein [Candidatus Campbellbacteria bacterium]